MDRKSSILASSYELMGREGLEHLNARAVAASMGLNHATVHYYFPSRKDLLLALADYARERFEADRERARANAGGGREVEAEVALYEAYCRPQSRFFRVWTSLFVAGQADEDVRTKLLEFTSLCQSRLADLGAQDASRTFATALGLGLMAQLSRDPEPARRIFDQMVEELG